MNIGRIRLSLVLVTGFSLVSSAVFMLSCRRPERNPEIVSRTALTGSVNAGTIDGRIEATINVGQGGHSSCQFDQLPNGFTPATLGTRA